MNLHKFALTRTRSCHWWSTVFCLTVVVLGLIVSPFAAAQTGAAEMKREYFIQQGADETLLIRITGNDADLSSNIYTSEKRLLLSSSTHGNRIAPLFQFIDNTGKDRQLDIEVISRQFSANSQFDIGITRLKVWDNRSQSLARAYSLLSFAMQASQSETAAGWTVKINSLTGAAETYYQFGMTELELWASWMAADLIQSRLNDNNMALGFLKEIQVATNATQWQEINLASQQTKSAALIGLMEKGGAATPADVQEQLLKTAEQAERMGFRVAQSQALYQSGLQYVAQNNEPGALESFEKSLAIAEDVNDAGLVKTIRESLADSHAEQGDDQATAEVLRQLEAQLALDENDSDELALNLLQQGRIFMRTWDYPQAIKVLQQALEFENDSSIASQINRELALASHEIGQPSEAANYLKAAGITDRDTAAYFTKIAQSSDADASGFRRQAESDYQTARSLAQNGRHAQAQQQLDQLLDQVLFLRQSLPGILGSWYWQRREALLDDYLALGVASDADALLALSKSRFAGKTKRWPSDTSELRNILMQSGAKDATAQAGLAQLRSQFSNHFKTLSAAGIHTFLAKMSANEVLLTYHLSKQGGFVWVADSNRVEMRRLANSGQLIGKLESMANGFSFAGSSQFDAEMSTLGGLYFSGLESDLKKTIYLVPSGLMLSLPFDSLRLNQRYLVENHDVVNVLSFPLGSPSSTFQPTDIQKVFLAGDPQNFQAEYAHTWQPSEPIKTVKDIFVGPGLNIIQGGALLPDEFQSEAFQQADLVHLSMPGVINLNHPDQSWLQLSEPLRDMGRMMLRPNALRFDALQADLVFMAGTQTEKQARSPLSQQLGLVSDVLQSGAKTVVAQLWSTPEDAVDSFLKAFYAELESNRSPSVALANTKRFMIRNNSNSDIKTWSSMQVYTQ